MVSVELLNDSTEESNQGTVRRLAKIRQWNRRVLSSVIFMMVYVNIKRTAKAESSNDFTGGRH